MAVVVTLLFFGKKEVDFNGQASSRRFDHHGVMGGLLEPKCLDSLFYIMGLDPEDSPVAPCARRNGMQGSQVNFRVSELLHKRSSPPWAIVPFSKETKLGTFDL